MAWIESHQSLSRHRKTLRAAGRLGVDRHKLIGHLHELWWWGLDNAGRDGQLEDVTPYEIATAAEWDGDAQEFVDALIYAGFIDQTENGIALHDWYDYAGKLLERREKDRERARQRREDVQRTSNGHPGGSPDDDHQTSNGTVPYPTVPNHEKGNTSSGTAPESPPYDEIVGLYHELCPSLPKVRRLNNARRKAIRSRWKECGGDLSVFRELFETAQASDFLSGRNGKWTSCNIDWLLSPTNMAKVLEGTYNNRGSPHARDAPDHEDRRVYD